MSYKLDQVLVDDTGTPVEFSNFLTQLKGFQQSLADAQSGIDAVTAKVADIYKQFPAEVPQTVIDAFGLSQQP